MTYGHLGADCLYTGISSGPNAWYRIWERLCLYLLTRNAKFVFSRPFLTEMTTLPISLPVSFVLTYMMKCKVFSQCCRNRVISMFHHAYDGYLKYAFGTVNKKCRGWCGSAVGIALDLRSVGRGFTSYSRQHYVTTLGKLFTPMCLCHQTV